MADITTNYGLQKPFLSEKVDVNVFNQNMDVIDTNMKTISDNATIGETNVKAYTDSKVAELNVSVEANKSDISNHINDIYNPHNVTKEQIGLENVENKSSETIRNELTKDNITTALGYTPPTSNEIDNKFSTLETNIDWKEAVDTYDDIATTYPNPEDGWTVNVKDTDYTYRYNGTEWVAISANAIPKATNDVDGILSKEDHTNYDDANSKKHTHDNKSVLDGITSDLIGNWNAAKTHADSAHAPTDAEANVIDSVKVNGVALTVSDKSVDVTVPSKTSQLTNDSGFKTTDNNTTYTLSKSGSTITLTGSDGNTSHVTDTDTTYNTATSIEEGLTKLYSDVGTNTDGTMTQKAISDALDGKSNLSHTHSQYTNQNAFSNVVVDSTTIAADSATDTLTLIAGENITLTPDATNDKITISSQSSVSDRTTYEDKFNWENTANGTYQFVQSGEKWISNNGGVSSSTATSTWTITLKESCTYNLIYRVSSEANCDKLTITLDGTTIVNAISGNGTEQVYTTTLTSGTHTIVATYTKDGSVNSYEDMAYLIISEPYGYSDGITYSVLEPSELKNGMVWIG